MATIHFVSQTVTKHELLLLEHLAFLDCALIFNVCRIRGRSTFCFFNHGEPGVVCNGVGFGYHFSGLIVLQLHPSWGFKGAVDA